jgi:hypothetical protein
MCVSSVAISGGCFVFFCWLQELNRFLDTPINIVHTVLQLNEQALKFSPEKLISVTAYNGAVGSALPKEFPDFADTPGIFRHAAVRYPTLYVGPNNGS